MGVRGPMGWGRAFRTPLWLGGVFVGLLIVFALTPDPQSATGASEPSAEPTPGPRECVVCPIDQRCDVKSGQCKFLDHTPLPCVKTATYDERAGFCLPESVPAAPVAAETPDGRTARIPGPEFPGGIGGDSPRQPNLPGFGGDDDD
jgi:hypothetical protein